MFSRLKQPQPGPSNRFTHAGMFPLVYDNMKYHLPHNWNLDNTANDIKVQSLLNYTCTECMLEALLTCDIYKSQRCTYERLGTLSIKNFQISH